MKAREVKKGMNECNANEKVRVKKNFKKQRHENFAPAPHKPYRYIVLKIFEHNEAKA